MGTMPFHLEKGVMGLRFDYLTRCPKVRAHLLPRLQAPGANAFAIARTISITLNTGAILNINALDDSYADFKNEVDALWNDDPTKYDPHEKRTAVEYKNDERGLDKRNRDTPGNRLAFAGYWETFAPTVNPNISVVIVQALVNALNAALPGDRPRIDYWWDCSLRDGDMPTVICSLDVPRVARVFFSTPHAGVVEAEVRNALPAR